MENIFRIQHRVGTMVSNSFVVVICLIFVGVTTLLFLGIDELIKNFEDSLPRLDMAYTLAFTVCSLLLAGLFVFVAPVARNFFYGISSNNTWLQRMYISLVVAIKERKKANLEKESETLVDVIDDCKHVACVDLLAGLELFETDAVSREELESIVAKKLYILERIQSRITSVLDDAEIFDCYLKEIFVKTFVHLRDFSSADCNSVVWVKLYRTYTSELVESMYLFIDLSIDSTDKKISQIEKKIWKLRCLKRSIV